MKVETRPSHQTLTLEVYPTTATNFLHQSLQFL